jgi:hypothetical protein
LAIIPVPARNHRHVGKEGQVGEPVMAELAWNRQISSNAGREKYGNATALKLAMVCIDKSQGSLVLDRNSLKRLMIPALKDRLPMTISLYSSKRAALP